MGWAGMQTYEIRFLNAGGGTVLLYFTQCTGDADALARASRIKNVAYHSFELWDGSRKAGEGPCPDGDGAAPPDGG